MNYQMHFDPYLIEHLNQRHEELLQQMEVLRLEERLREKRVPRREMIELAYFGGLSQREISPRTGVPLGTVKR